MIGIVRPDQVSLFQQFLAGPCCKLIGNLGLLQLATVPDAVTSEAYDQGDPRQDGPKGSDQPGPGRRQLKGGWFCPGCLSGICRLSLAGRLFLLSLFPQAGDQWGIQNQLADSLLGRDLFFLLPRLEGRIDVAGQNEIGFAALLADVSTGGDRLTPQTQTISYGSGISSSRRFSFDGIFSQCAIKPVPCSRQVDLILQDRCGGFECNMSIKTNSPIIDTPAADVTGLFCSERFPLPFCLNFQKSAGKIEG